MATFYCSECNFSKPVKDEMAGKKARCPKCNAVNVVPELGEEPETETDTEPVVEDYQEEESPAAPAMPENEAAEETTAESQQVAESESVKTTASAPVQSTSESSVNGFPMLSSGWLMVFGAALLPFVAGILLLSLKFIGLAMICFAIGMVAFGGLAAYYSFT